MLTLEKKLQYLSEKLSDENFFKKRGLANEVPYYVFDYDPKDELKVREYIKTLVRKSNEQPYSKKIVDINLFECFIEILKNRNILEKAFEMEEKSGKERLFNALKATANVERFLDVIKKKVEDCDVLFIWGVGSVYPFLRAHKLLNNLQHTIDNIPIVLFYPGDYTGTTLNLFSMLKDDNYYRAFQIEIFN